MLDWAALQAAAVRGAAAGAKAAADLVAASAKNKAPVRRIFSIQDQQVGTRLKTEDEIHADAGLRQRLGMRSENAYLYPPSIVTERAQQYLTHRTIGAIDMAALSRRGSYEVKSQRAAHKNQIGGRLRDEITVTEVMVDGNHVHVDVISPTSYAKQQEMGNRHNPAHPYLRPALYEGKDEARSIIAAAVVASARTGLKAGQRAKVTIKLKAVAGA
jgi:HK97 gp10 family phage protein